MSKNYKNNGKRWSNEEDEQLLKELSENLSFEELSNIHQRSISALKAHIFIKAVNDHKNKVVLDEIYIKYKLNETTFNEALEYVNKKESEKGEKSEKKKEKVKSDKVEEVKEKDLNTLLLKELLHEMREIKLIMKEFLIKNEINNNSS
jgi:hypothetical protein